MSVQWLSKEKLFSVATKFILPAVSVLDIGSGIYPQEFIAPKIHICCEPYKEYVESLQKKYTYDKRFLFLQATWQQAILLFPPKSVDTVFLLDIIEHLPKKEGKKLLALTEKIARKQIIIFTPLGFITQFHENNKDAWGMGGGEWQKHKSGWLPKDFNSSWETYACKNFHSTFYEGVARKKTFGAFWAIKTFQDTASKASLSKRLSAALLSVLPKQHPVILFL